MTAYTALAQYRISRLAACVPVHRAFSWLHLHQPQLRAWQLEMLAIPAPPFAESARAAWFLERFIALGLSNPHIDEVGNAVAELPSQQAQPPRPPAPPRAPFIAPLSHAMSGSTPDPSRTPDPPRAPFIAPLSQAMSGSTPNPSRPPAPSRAPFIAPLSQAMSGSTPDPSRTPDPPRAPFIAPLSHAMSGSTPDPSRPPAPSRAPFIAPLSQAMSGSTSTPPPQPALLVSAHLDTVFPPGTPTVPTEDGPRILGPGSCDNAAGLTALLAVIAALRHAEIPVPIPILFSANVGEEGEGNLRGIRHLVAQRPNRIAACLALEGSGTAAVVTRALGSRRFRVTITGPGGHSWSDAGAPNPILLISQALTTLAGLPSLLFDADTPRTTLSPGHISGGTSINSIPASATVLLDLRSTDPAQLDTHAAEIHRVFESFVAQANQSQPTNLKIELIGDRPAAELPAGSPLLSSLRAVDRHLGIRTDPRLGSTDANLPLSLGIPAAALAAGGTGGGIHTLAEWYDPTGRELALRRILLLILDLTNVFQTQSDSP